MERTDFQLISFKELIERINNFRWEAQLGISTGGIVEIDKPDSCHYSSIDYSIIHKVLGRLSLQTSDVFADVGSGKGRVLCCAARHACKKVIGIEYSEEFCKDALINIQKMRGRKAPFHIYSGVAEEFDYPEVTALYLFNPFGSTTLDTMLHKVQVDTYPHPVRMAFVNPSAAQDAVFAKHAWLERYDHWSPGVAGGHAVSFYRRRA